MRKNRKESKDKRSGLDTSIFRPNSFKHEGEDHINVSLSSQTKIGRLLDPSTRNDFEYPILGKFRSVMNLIYWLRCEQFDDRLRHCNRKDMLRIFKLYPSRKIDNFNAITLYGLWLKVNNNPEIKKEIKNLSKNIKILSYTQCKVSGLRETTLYAQNLIPVIEELIRAIKEDRQPNFKNFLSGEGSFETGFIQPSILERFKVNIEGDSLDSVGTMVDDRKDN